MKELILFRKTKMLTQKQMAVIIGVSISYYSKVEAGYKKAGRNFIEKFKSNFPDAGIDSIFFN